MKKIFVLCVVALIAFQAKSQTVKDTSFTNYADSGAHYVQDTIPDSTVGQRLAYIFAPLATDQVTTGILMDMNILL